MILLLLIIFCKFLDIHIWTIAEPLRVSTTQSQSGPECNVIKRFLRMHLTPGIDHHQQIQFGIKPIPGFKYCYLTQIGLFIINHLFTNIWIVSSFAI